MKWGEMLDEAPERVVSLIEQGPTSLQEYGSDRFNCVDKRYGLVKFKGGDGRGRVNVKSGMAAVVYFDPNFIQLGEAVYEIPSEVFDRHSEEQVLSAFEEL